MNPSLNLKGHSGCFIDIKQNNESFFVRKSTSNIAYNDRLNIQMDKQIHFFDQCNSSDYFLTTDILSHGYSNNHFWFDMDYVHGLKALDYFALCDVNSLNIFTQQLIKYFDNQIDSSEIIASPSNVIMNKVEALSQILVADSKIDDEIHSELFSFLENNIPTENIYHYQCHGDFTLSNMIFTDGHVYTIDFLDSFIDSPLIDIVKLRQDTHIERIFCIDTNVDNIRINRAKITVKYIDQMTHEYIKKNHILNSWYSYLQVLNLARILPYTRCSIELNFLLSNIKKLILL